MTEWRIRDGRRADAEAVVALWARAGAVATPTDDPGSLTALIEHDPLALLVAEDEPVAGGSGLVGSIIAAWDGWRGSFYRLAVDPAHRRRGIAGALVRVAERRLGERGAIRLNAIVAEGEAPAFAFWRSFGYEWRPDHLRFMRELGGPVEAAARGATARHAPPSGS